MWIYDEDNHILFMVHSFRLETVKDYELNSFTYIIVAYGLQSKINISKHNTKEEAIEALLEIKNNIKGIE